MKTKKQRKKLKRHMWTPHFYQMLVQKPHSIRGDMTIGKRKRFTQRLEITVYLNASLDRFV